MNRVKERIVNADKKHLLPKKTYIFTDFHCDTPRFKFGKPRQSSGERKDGKKKKSLSRGEISLRMRRGIVEAGVKHKSGYVDAVRQK